MKSIVAENTKRIIENKCLKQGLVVKKAGYDAKKFSNMVNGRKIITDMDVIRIANRQLRNKFAILIKNAVRILQCRIPKMRSR